MPVEPAAAPGLAAPVRMPIGKSSCRPARSTAVSRLWNRQLVAVDATVERDGWWIQGVQWHPQGQLAQKQLRHEFLAAAQHAADERRGEEAL